MKKNKHIKSFNEATKNLNISDGMSNKGINEQLENHDKKEERDYEEGIKLYEDALDNIEKAILIFENTPWGIPEELGILFGERQGNEALWLLQKEVMDLSEISKR